MVRQPDPHLNARVVSGLVGGLVASWVVGVLEFDSPSVSRLGLLLTLGIASAGLAIGFSARWRPLALAFAIPPLLCFCYAAVFSWAFADLAEF